MTLPTPVKRMAAIMHEAATLNPTPHARAIPAHPPITPQEQRSHMQCSNNDLDNSTAQVQGLVTHVRRSLESSSGRFLISQTPLWSTNEPILIIFQTPPLQHKSVSWVKYATPEACRSLNPQALVKEICHIRSMLFDCQERNTDLAEKLIIAYTQLVLGSQYNERLHRCQGRFQRRRGPGVAPGTGDLVESGAAGVNGD
jgi:hypothetical protein